MDAAEAMAAVHRLLATPTNHRPTELPSLLHPFRFLTAFHVLLSLSASGASSSLAYSYRSAVTGSSRVACHAGQRHAVIATPTNNSVMDTSVTGSADPV